MISWQERFRKERSEKNNLRQQVLKLEYALTQSTIKCDQLERSAIDLGSGSRSDDNIIKLNKNKKPFNREEEDFIQDLRTRNKALQEEQKKLQNKLKGASLAVKKLKQQLSSLRLRKSSRALPRIGRSTSSSSSRLRSTRDNGPIIVDEEGEYSNGCNLSVGNVDSGSDSETDLKHILNHLQQRLLNADEEVLSLKEENRRLRREDRNGLKDCIDSIPIDSVDKVSVDRCYFNVMSSDKRPEKSLQ